MRIAIFGATSQIAKDLVISFSKFDDHELVLFARNTLTLDQWLASVGLSGRHSSKSYEDIENHKPFDVLINFVGVGDPAKAIEMGFSIFDLTYKYDNLALDYLRQNPNCQYLYLSSGAVYASNFKEPADENTKTQIPINNLQPYDWYGIVKLYTECRHRALQDHSIVDIRVFNYFSHTLDMSGRFFITDVARAIKKGTTLTTSYNDFFRDYLHPSDFYQLISKILQHKSNFALDCYSKAPIKKTVLLQFLQENFNLKYKCKNINPSLNSTGEKNLYYSLSRKASKFGYMPMYTSLDTVCTELNLYLSGAR